MDGKTNQNQQQFQELKKQFDENGYAVLPGFVTPEEVATLKGRIEHLIKEFEATEEFTIFSTKEQPVRSTPSPSSHPLPLQHSMCVLYVSCVVSCGVCRAVVGV
jgi:hypothetical protein